MAIAFDNKLEGTGTTSKTFTTSGTNRIIFIVARDTSNTFTGATYGGVSATLIANTSFNGARYAIAVYMLVNPAVGANTAAVQSTGSSAVLSQVISYNGVGQTGQPDSFATQGDVSQQTVNLSTTVATANSWAVIFTVSGNGSISAGTGTTLRSGNAEGFGIGVGDSNGTLTAGSHALELVYGGSASTDAIIVSFSPAAAVRFPRRVLLRQAVNRAATY